MDELKNVVVAIPKSKHYIAKLDKDIEAQKQAALKGDIDEMVKTVRKGAKDTKRGAHNVKPNPGLYKMGDQTAPNALNDLAAGFEDGTKTAKDENDLMGQFDKLVEDALANPTN